MSFNIKKLFVSDSRACNFNRYRNSSEIDFIIQRGAKISDLSQLVLSKLRTYRSDHYILLKFAAGINDFTTFTRRNREGKRTLTRSDKTAHNVLAQLLELKQQIISCHHNIIVTFVTIPPASFRKFQEHRQVTIFNDTELLQLQRELDQQIDVINSAIIAENKNLQLNIVPRTLSWHTSIRQPTQRRKYRNKFSKLYDGLHACSDLKRRWFSELRRSFDIEEQRLKAIFPSVNHVRRRSQTRENGGIHR